MTPTKAYRFSSTLDRLSLGLGTTLSWLTLAMVLLVALIVALRNLLGMGSIALQESVTYLHATVLMLCLGYNLQQGGHVRVDVFYSRFNKHRKAWVDALGSVLFLLPFAVFVSVVSIDFVLRSWHIGETSPDPGGLPLVYLLKTLLPLAGFLLVLQAISEALKAIVTLTWD
ncbi:TRAP-type mannitol/chloroaromatic compound transport system permease small subunit [Alteromonadaceae bacterium 2753L.S.0a.02]|nr:TRAP-type mannitol/chloroaromatic compound transport system permease small subunit [Alteromonadaceae bacterium 2753L.S.0a.02]